MIFLGGVDYESFFCSIFLPRNSTNINNIIIIMNICKTVTLRTRMIKKGTMLSLYLDYYPGYRNETTMKVSLTQTILPKWLIEVGISKHITYHSSRHTFGSLQVEAGTSIYVVQKMMAHRNIATTQIYSELSDARKRESVDKITLKPKRI